MKTCTYFGGQVAGQAFYTIGFVLFLALYIVSGFGKMVNFGGTSKSIMSTLGTCNRTANFLTVSSIAVEFGVSLALLGLLLYYVYGLPQAGENFDGDKVGIHVLSEDDVEHFRAIQITIQSLCGVLILFTILITLLYHRNDLPGVMKNVALIGGFFLILASV